MSSILFSGHCQFYNFGPSLQNPVSITEVVLKLQIALKLKARADAKAQHTYEYVSILRRSATLRFGVRWDFETTSSGYHSTRPHHIHPLQPSL